MMRATKFEFEQRFWIIGVIISIGFCLYFVDKTNFAVGLMKAVAPSIDLDGTRGIFLLRLIFGAGALLVFLAAMLRTWATAYLRTEIVHDAGQHSEALVADGPYRYTRNPLYLLNLPMIAGIGVMASRAGWLFMLIATWVFVYRLILREEDGLMETQGDAYHGYQKAVPRFWPALTPRVPSSGRLPLWGQAFAGELIFWIFGAAVLCFACTLNIKWSGVVFGGGVLAYFLIVPQVKKRAAASGAKPELPA